METNKTKKYKEIYDLKIKKIKLRQEPIWFGLYFIRKSRPFHFVSKLN